MRTEVLAGIAFGGLVVLGFVFGKVPQSYNFQQQANAKADPPIIVRDMGPYEHVNGLKSPTYETLCIRATNQCRKVWHPALHQKLVTFCHEPPAPGGVVFYDAKDPYCQNG